MFDGIVDIGVDYVNGKGKQRSVSNFFNALDQLWTTWMHRWININLIFLRNKFETDKSRHTNWEPNWDIKEEIKRNQNHYTVGTMADRQYFWPKFMGGWVSIGEVMDNSFVDG